MLNLGSLAADQHSGAVLQAQRVFSTTDRHIFPSAAGIVMNE
jgi:hypothetical protein